MGLLSKVKSAVSKAVSTVSKAVSSVVSKPSPAPTPSKSTSSVKSITVSQLKSPTVFGAKVATSSSSVKEATKQATAVVAANAIVARVYSVILKGVIARVVLQFS